MSHLILCWVRELDEMAPKAKTFWVECMKWFGLNGRQKSAEFMTLHHWYHTRMYLSPIFGIYKLGSLESVP